MKTERHLGRNIFVAAILVAVAAGLGVAWKVRAERQRDRELVAAFIAAARAGQQAAPCGVAVEAVAQVSQRAKGLRAPACAAEPADGKEIIDGYENVAKSYDSIAEAVSRFDVGKNVAASEAVTRVGDISDSELKRGVVEATAALARRERVTAAVLADWRQLSQATSRYAQRLDAGLLRGDKAACEGLEHGVAAKSAAEIVVGCHNDFDKSRTDLDAKLARLEQMAQR
jgi:hypothetical protein